MVSFDVANVVAIHVDTWLVDLHFISIKYFLCDALLLLSHLVPRFVLSAVSSHVELAEEEAEVVEVVQREAARIRYGLDNSWPLFALFHPCHHAENRLLI